MSELGQVLQRAREEKGISLDDIQRMTKIQRRYLEAIERGHFHLLPGHFYARAFIKSYAEAVGLDPNHILNHFQADLPAQPPQEQLERLRRRRASTTGDKLQAGRWVTRTLLVLFVGLIIGVIYMAFVNNNNLETQPLPGNNAANSPDVVQNPAGGTGGGTTTPPPAAQNPMPQPPPVVTPPPVTETPVEEKPAIKFDSQQGRTYNYSLSGGDKISIKLTAKTDNCWVEVYEAKGKKAIQSGMVKKGEEKVYELGKTAYLKLGKPTSLEVLVNGAPIDVTTFKFFPSFLQVKIQPVTAPQP